MEPEGLLPHSQPSSTRPYPGLAQSQYNTRFIKFLCSDRSTTCIRLSTLHAIEEATVGVDRRPLIIN